MYTQPQIQDRMLGFLGVEPIQLRFFHGKDHFQMEGQGIWEWKNEWDFKKPKLYEAIPERTKT